MANRQDELVFKALKKAYLSGKIEILTDMGILNRYGSPVYNPWQNIMPIVALSLLGLAVIFCMNVFYGLITIIIGFFVQQIYVRTVVEKIVRDKVLDIMFRNMGNFQYIWQMKVITIVMKDNSSVGCKAKDNGDLKTFVALNLSDDMLDKTSDENLKMPPPPPDLEQMIKEAKARLEAAKAKNRKTDKEKTVSDDDFEEDESKEDI